MHSLLRSKHGCWTCRIRRKKCDETSPICLTCESLCITCHGYGPKPEWMDNGEKEKAMSHDIKQIVKLTSRRKGRSRLESAITKLQEQYYSPTDGEDTGKGNVKIAPKVIDAESRYLSPKSNASHRTTSQISSTETTSIEATSPQSRDLDEVTRPPFPS